MLARWFQRQRFGAEERAMLYETLRNFVRQGFSPFDVIKKIEQNSRLFRVLPLDVLRALMGSMRGAHRNQDASLGSALRPWVPNIESTIVTVGERTQRLATALDEAAQLIRFKSRLTGLIVGNLSYPAFLLLLAATGVSVLSAFLVPTLDGIQERDQWGPSARALGFMADHGNVLYAVIMAVVALFVAVFFSTLNRRPGAFRDLLDRYVPPWSIYRKIQASTALLSLSMLVTSGVPFATAVELLRDCSSPWMREHMVRILMRLRAGNSEGAALAGSAGPGTLFDALTAWEISLYSANSSMASKLRDLAQGSIDRVEATIRRTSIVLRFVGMVLVVLVALLVYSSFLSATSGVTGVGGVAMP